MYLTLYHFSVPRSYYVCALSVNPCQDVDTSLHHNAGLRSESQVIGLAITLASCIAAIVGTSAPAVGL